MCVWEMGPAGMVCSACHPYVSEAVIDKHERQWKVKGGAWVSRVRREEIDSQWRINEEMEHSISRASKWRMGRREQRGREEASDWHILKHRQEEENTQGPWTEAKRKGDRPMQSPHSFFSPPKISPYLCLPLAGWENRKQEKWNIALCVSLSDGSFVLFQFSGSIVLVLKLWFDSLTQIMFLSGVCGAGVSTLRLTAGSS